MIKDNLFKQKNNILSLIPILDELEKMSKNLKNDMIRYKSLTTEILKNLRKITVGYNALSNDYTKKYKIFDYITK